MTLDLRKRNVSVCPSSGLRPAPRLDPRRLSRYSRDRGTLSQSVSQSCKVVEISEMNVVISTGAPAIPLPKEEAIFGRCVRPQHVHRAFG